MPAYPVPKDWSGGTTLLSTFSLRVREAMAAKSQQSPINKNRVKILVIFFKSLSIIPIKVYWNIYNKIQVTQTGNQHRSVRINTLEHIHTWHICDRYAVSEGHGEAFCMRNPLWGAVCECGIGNSICERGAWVCVRKRGYGEQPK